MALAQASTNEFGEQLRTWRSRRKLSQLELSLQAGVSGRHLSFLETGRSRPSREMVVHLAQVLDVPLRHRNAMLTAAGFAPAHTARPLDDEAMRAVHAAVDQLLAAHEPNPAVAVDSHWDLVAANAAAGLFIEQVDPALLSPPVNVVRATLHPDGLARHIVNLDHFAGHLVHRLRRQADHSGDPSLESLLEEVTGYVPGLVEVPPAGTTEVVLPLVLLADGVELRFLTTMSVFGAPLDVTVDELAVETFFAADAATAEHLRRRAAG